MNKERGVWFCALVTVLALALIISPALAGKKQPSEGKVAVVNGAVITQEDFNREMSNVQQRLSSMGKSLRGSQLSEIKKEALENLIDRELLYQESQRRGMKVDEAAIREHLEMLKKRFPSEAEFKSALSKMNLSETTIKSQVKQGMAIQELINKEIVGKVKVSHEEMKTYYNTHPDFFKQPEQVRASHILIKVDLQAGKPQKAEAHKKLEKVQQRLQKGEDFAALAKEVSQCPSSSRGGDLGYFRRGQMVKPFEDVAFALRLGEASNIVETKFGYHLIKVVDKKPETAIVYQDIKDRLEQFLKQKQVQKEVSLYVKKLKEKARVKRFLTQDP